MEPSAHAAALESLLDRRSLLAVILVLTKIEGVEVDAIVILAPSATVV